MMRLKVENLGQGLHPSELVVAVPTRNGPEELVIHPKSLNNGFLSIGWPVGSEENFRLVELPRQTSGGSRRVWVDKSYLVEDAPVKVSA
jgi:hypothetical protein